MLKLSRRAKPTESVYLVDDKGVAIAKVKVMRIDGNQVSLGFQAKNRVRVLRSEIVSPDVREQYDSEVHE